MSLEKPQNTGGKTSGSVAGSLELRDPRRRPRPCPPAPPPPRISDKIADKIEVPVTQSNPEDKRSSLSSQADLGPSEVTQAQIKNYPILDAAKSIASTGENENEVKTGQLNSTPGRIERSSSPYSPSSPLRDDDEIAKDHNNCKTKANRSSEDVIEHVSMFLKTRDDSLAKYRKNFSDLRKRYDTKKAELSVVQTHVKDLRKQVEMLSREKKEMQQSLEKEVENLEEELRKVKADLKTLEDEKEARCTTDSEVTSKLEYTQIALDGQKLLAEMHCVNVSKLQSENDVLKKNMASQNARISLMMDRIKALEAAIKEDVDDKNVMVGSFNLYMANTQRRLEDLFVKKAGCMEDPTEEKYNASSMSQVSQSAIKGESGERAGIDIKPPSPSAERIAFSCNPPNPDSKQAVVKKEEVSNIPRNEKGDDKKRKLIFSSDDDDSSSSGDSVIVLSQTGPVDRVPIESQNKKPKVE